MGTIHLLDKELINKIAAGEVIERPASVVKELIENSIDAGADVILVDVIEGGKSHIRVEDNGSGMARDDATLSLERHATSKISRAEDLFNISSLGFRGEALSSIAAVSRLRLKSKTAETLVGTLVESADGHISVSDAACPKGTIIEVDELFYNTPARKKYLKAIESEQGEVIDVVTRYALGFPGIFFKLTNNGKLVLSSPSTTDILGNISNIYGRALAKQMLSVSYSAVGLEISGFISRPSMSKPGKDFQTIFVNGRYVKNNIISNALNDAYHTLLAQKRHPVAVLDINIDPKEIDVNVHPTKREIKISHESVVYDAIFGTVRRTLTEHELIPEVIEQPTQQSVLITKREIQKKQPVSKKYDAPKGEQSLLREQAETQVATKRLPDMRVLAQLHNTYILAESSDGLLLIDQHVAQERVNYERFMRQHAQKNIATQVLLAPIVIQLDPSRLNLVLSNTKLLGELGFAVEEFGKDSVVVRTFPSVLPKQDKQLVQDIIDELERAKYKIHEEQERLLIMHACKASVKAHDLLSMPQMIRIVEELSKADMPFSCPHGRPAMIRLTIAEIEKMFKRR